MILRLSLSICIKVWTEINWRIMVVGNCEHVAPSGALLPTIIFIKAQLEYLWKVWTEIN
jgi:hypothetical protein